MLESNILSFKKIPRKMNMMIQKKRLLKDAWTIGMNLFWTSLCLCASKENMFVFLFLTMKTDVRNLVQIKSNTGCFLFFCLFFDKSQRNSLNYFFLFFFFSESQSCSWAKKLLGFLFVCSELKNIGLKQKNIRKCLLCCKVVQFKLRM